MIATWMLLALSSVPSERVIDVDMVEINQTISIRCDADQLGLHATPVLGPVYINFRRYGKFDGIWRHWVLDSFCAKDVKIEKVGEKYVAVVRRMGHKVVVRARILFETSGVDTEIEERRAYPLYRRKRFFGVEHIPDISSQD